MTPNSRSSSNQALIMVAWMVSQEKIFISTMIITEEKNYEWAISVCVCVNARMGCTFSERKDILTQILKCSRNIKITLLK